MLTEGIQGLQKLKKKGKGVTKAIIEEREKQVREPDLQQKRPAVAAPWPAAAHFWCFQGAILIDRGCSSGSLLKRILAHLVNLQVQKLIEKIFAIPDGIGGNRRPMRVSLRWLGALTHSGPTQ